MEVSWPCILSPVCSMERRMFFSFGLASSAISSSERMQRWISLARPVRGVSSSKYSSRVSRASSSGSGLPPRLSLSESLSFPEALPPALPSFLSCLP